MHDIISAWDLRVQLGQDTLMSPDIDRTLEALSRLSFDQFFYTLAPRYLPNIYQLSIKEQTDFFSVQEAIQARTLHAQFIANHADAISKELETYAHLLNKALFFYDHIPRQDLAATFKNNSKLWLIEKNRHENDPLYILALENKVIGSHINTIMQNTSTIRNVHATKIDLNTRYEIYRASPYELTLDYLHTIPPKDLLKLSLLTHNETDDRAMLRTLVLSSLLVERLRIELKKAQHYAHHFSTHKTRVHRLQLLLLRAHRHQEKKYQDNAQLTLEDFDL